MCLCRPSLLKANPSILVNLKRRPEASSMPSPAAGFQKGLRQSPLPPILEAKAEKVGREQLPVKSAVEPSASQVEPKGAARKPVQKGAAEPAFLAANGIAEQESAGLSQPRKRRRWDTQAPVKIEQAQIPDTGDSFTSTLLQRIVMHVIRCGKCCHRLNVGFFKQLLSFFCK